MTHEMIRAAVIAATLSGLVGCSSNATTGLDDAATEAASLSSGVEASPNQ